MRMDPQTFINIPCRQTRNTTVLKTFLNVLGVGNPRYGRGRVMSHVTSKCVTKADPHCFSLVLHHFLIDFDETNCKLDL
jgi:hypothetical protein